MKALVDSLIADGCGYGDIQQEVESAVLTRWRDLPKLSDLRKRIHQGDHLIIEARDRIARDPRGVDMLEFLNWAERHKIILHIMEDGPQPIDLRAAESWILEFVKAFSAGREAQKIKERTRAALQYRKQLGLCYNRSTPFGKRKTILPLLPGQEKPYKGWEWDEQQCNILREIVDLRDNGHWTFPSIAQMLDARGERGPAGGRWGTLRGDGRYACTSVRLAYQAVKRWREQGIEIGGGAVMPATVASQYTPSPPRRSVEKAYRLLLMEKRASLLEPS
jgi:DNA invertase Pin-like site-specific DNA recombinase